MEVLLPCNLLTLPELIKEGFVPIIVVHFETHWNITVTSQEAAISITCFLNQAFQLYAFVGLYVWF